MDKEMQVYALLEELAIPYELYEHQPAHTMDEIADMQKEIGGIYCKNLFLRNSKGNENYLVLVDGNKRVDLKSLAREIQSTRLSFGSPQRLLKYLGLAPGEVGPFGLINDKDREITVIIDASIVKAPYIGFHPNNNAKTVVISYEDLINYLHWTKHLVKYVQL